MTAFAAKRLKANAPIHPGVSIGFVNKLVSHFLLTPKLWMADGEA
jgi:hypothetical protein